MSRDAAGADYGDVLKWTMYATGGILDACTRCGRCVEVCPAVPFAGLADALEAYRAVNEWQAIAREALPKLRASGIDFDAEALAAVLPEVFSSAEFRGGLQAFAGADA